MDNRVVLPAQHLVHYAELKRLLETSGGQYSSKGFAFPDGIDAAEVIECVRVGKALNGKKTSQCSLRRRTKPTQSCGKSGH